MYQQLSQQIQLYNQQTHQQHKKTKTLLNPWENVDNNTHTLNNNTTEKKEQQQQ